ncbi:MAG: class I SAM-dependent methyltransferase [Nitrospiria bacterium]
MDLYERQKRYFEAAYRTGDHAWPISGASGPVVRFLGRFKLEKASGRVLDIGCGEGRHAGFFSRSGYWTIGLDYQPEALARAADLVQDGRPNLFFVLGDVFHLPFARERFDVLIDYGCLHHVRKRDTDAYLKSVVPLLKSGGYLLLCCFSTDFKHHPDEKRTRDWLVHKGHYDRFFKKESFQSIFGADFDVIHIEEERETLYVFFHVVMRKKK